ncbi:MULTISPECIES: HvfX family Cu-binding RiPP maturation protein [Chryseobacterium]|uniref:Oxidoreductase n=1 Tax=Chryseobacterium camelliae TaxID=1265445 RepID=A0ABU0TLH0_9FLAO|nr:MULTISPECIES: DoxX family protein [Chryseobacterium]MDT3409074.1 putative oxidoreductase [Pseudacidovorax intermedius]MDQ1097068.1 putative oxidoreductase [Chryseobacterium camelliae]MDQ1101006.1 putative oxidoreductase [Chryseobacterium sp. SORGH_AS_1048]MDR6084448.1 putative oxidoreductase [Chryseobacterium sp. SORGH_AS_0909]MDR6132719.1 putative oxidoreductase [Chryseobacterium sp. SORGH_AS_1175]
MKNKYNHFLDQTKSFVLLFIRLILAYGFLNPAMMKLQDIDSIAEWFQSINIPMPVLSAYLATSTEVLGVILLTLGLFTRFIGIPLIITMIVAIFSVHLENGFEAGNNGIEIPLYYIVMLLVLLANGSGKISVDHLLEMKNLNKINRENVDAI